MFCPNCKNELPDEAQFCTNCGHVLKSEIPAPSTPAQVVAKKPSPIKYSVIGFGLLPVALYACICAIFFLLLSLKDVISIESLYAEEVVARMTFGEFLTLLRNGNRIFLPTVISTAFGVGLPILYWLIPLFGLWASIGAMMKKNTTRLCVAASIMIGFTALLTAAAIPLTLWLVPGLKQAMALQAGIMAVDLGKIASLMPIILAAVAIVLMIAVIIVTNVYRKWRADK